MEYDLYKVTKQGRKFDNTNPEFLPEEKDIMACLLKQPLTAFGLQKEIKELFNKEVTHYKIKQCLAMLKAQGYVEIRESKIEGSK